MHRLLPLTALLALAGPAHAQSYVEIQLDNPTLTNAVEGALATFAPCAMAWDCPSTGGPGCVVDHLELGGQVSIHGVSPAAVTVPVDVHVLECAGEPGCVPVVESTQLNVTLSTVLENVAPPQAPTELQWQLCMGSDLFDLELPCFPLPTELLEGFTGSAGAWDVAGGVDLETSEPRVALRYDALGSAQSPWWSVFYDNVFYSPPSPIADPVSLFAGRDLFTGPIPGMMTNEIPFGFTQNGDVDVTWSGYGSYGELKAEMSLFMPPVAGLPTGLAEVSLAGIVTYDPTLVSCVDGGGLCSHINLDLALDLELDETLAFWLALDQAALLEEIVESHVDAFEGEDFEGLCVNLGDWNLRCSVEIPSAELALDGPNGPTTLGIQATGMWADWYGVHLYGSAPVTLPSPSLDIHVNEPTYGVHGSCNSFSVGFDGRIDVVGQHGRCDVDIAHTGYWNPVLDYGTPGDAAGMGFGPVGWLPNPSPPAAYPSFVDPSLYLTVYSTAGIETVSLDLPPHPTAEQGAIADQALIAKQLNCAQAAAIYVELPWLEDLIAPIDPWEDFLRDQLVHVLDADYVEHGVAAIGDLAFAHSRDGTYLEGLLVTVGTDESVMVPFSSRVSGPSDLRPEALEERLLAAGVRTNVALPDWLGEEPGLHVEVWVQAGADHESEWIERFLELEADAPGDDPSDRPGDGDLPRDEPGDGSDDRPVRGG